MIESKILLLLFLKQIKFLIIYMNQKTYYKYILY